MQQAAGPSGGGTAVQLEKLAVLHSDGKIDDAAYQQLKAKILAP